MYLHPFTMSYMVHNSYAVWIQPFLEGPVWPLTREGLGQTLRRRESGLGRALPSSHCLLRLRCSFCTACVAGERPWCGAPDWATSQRSSPTPSTACDTNSYKHRYQTETQQKFLLRWQYFLTVVWYRAVNYGTKFSKPALYQTTVRKYVKGTYYVNLLPS
jgi:hypothetical protein